MKRLILFFIKGPGIVLVLCGAGIFIAWIIRQERDKAEAQAAKHQVQRPLGHLKSEKGADTVAAPKEIPLATRELPPPLPAPTAFTQVSNPVSEQRETTAKPLGDLVAFYTAPAATPAPTATPEPKKSPPSEWLPPGIFIPCKLVNTVESSKLNTPVVGFVTHDVWQKDSKGFKRLIIPSGTLVNCFAQSGAVRDRIEVAGNWVFVWPDGRQETIQGVACDREEDPTTQQFGIEDGSSGLQGEVIESNYWANAQAFLSLLITNGTQVGTAAVNGVLSRGSFAGGGGVALPDTSGIVGKYTDQLWNGETGDSRFVRVLAGTEFYVYPVTVTLPRERSILGNKEAGMTGNKPDQAEQISDPSTREALQVGRQIMQQATGKSEPDEDQRPKFSY